MVGQTATPVSDQRLALTDLTRGIAALLVVALHATEMIGKPKYFGIDPTHHFFHFGNRGVDFFFVLSGFIIAYVHWSDLGRKEKLLSYALKRGIRVYLPLWALAVPFLIACWALKADLVPAGGFARLEQAAGSLLLLPTRELPLPVVVWTLKHEVLFYFVFALLLWRPNWGAALIGIGSGLCVYHGMFGFTPNFIVDFLCSVYNLEFILGVGCGILARQVKIPYPALVCTLGVVLFGFAAANYEQPGLVRPWLANASTLSQAIQFGLSSALIILGLQQIDRSSPVKMPAWLAIFGSASYAIYLVHAPFMSFGSKVLTVASEHLPISPTGALCLLMLGGVSAGIMMHVLVEVPLVRWGRSLVLGQERKPATVPQGSAVEARPNLATTRLL